MDMMDIMDMFKAEPPEMAEHDLGGDISAFATSGSPGRNMSIMSIMSIRTT